MYCITCGVKLSDTEKQCPLCGTIPFHPDIVMPDALPLFPQERNPHTKVSPWGILWVVSGLMVVAILTVLLCDLQLSGSVTWSGYVIGGLGVCYVTFLLPLWFKRPNPAIFVPCAFVAIGLYLLYINLATGGHWFLSFAFPVVGFFGVLLTTVTTLLRYIRKGRLYIYGGGFIALGGFMPLMEFLLNHTFLNGKQLLWAYFPMGALVLFGGFLVFLALCRPAREVMTRKFFI